jgi:xylulokinase
MPMSRRSYIMAHDLGTSSHKCTVFDLEGHAVASASAEYPTMFGERGEAEQDPRDWWEAVVRTTRSVLQKVKPSAILAVGFSGHMMGACPVDREGNPLARSLIHADTRSAILEKEVFGRMDEEAFYSLTGNRIDGHYPLLKIIWLRQNRRDVYAKTAFFVQAKDYLCFRLTGRLGITDYSDASLYGLCHIRDCRWDERILRAFSLDAAKLPAIVPAATVAGTVTAEAAGVTGLTAGTPVALGGGDGLCAALGAFALHPGDAYMYIGTTAWVSRAVGAPMPDPERRVFTMSGADAGTYYAIGTMQTAGAAYDWAVRELAKAEYDEARRTGTSPYERVETEIAKVPWGSNGLLFHPYLMGERSPLWDMNVRGTFFGLDMSHNRFDLLRSVMEGVSMNLRSIAQVLEAGGETDTYRVIGGAMKSGVWRSILATMLNKRLEIPDLAGEATSLGAAMCAGVAAGAYRSYDDARKQMEQKTVRAEPVPEGRSVCDAAFGLYQRLYEKCKDEYSVLCSMRREGKQGGSCAGWNRAERH